MSSSTRPAFWVALVVVLLLCIEAGAYAIQFASARLLSEPIRRRSAILREQSQRIAQLLDTSRVHREQLDSVLGWRYRAGFASASDHVNAQGLRARRDYAASPPPSTLRVAAFGDSFVYGNEVSDGDAWTTLLEACGNDLEILNYGVGGYGLDQAYLRFVREGMTLRPSVVLIGFTPDDLRRIVNVYRRFISTLELPLAKPRFLLGPRQSLTLVPNPLAGPDAYRRLLEHPLTVRELGKLDAWYSPTIYENPLYDYLATLRVAHALAQRVSRRYLDADRLFVGDLFNDRSSTFALQVAVLRAFSAAVLDRGAVPAIVMMPDHASIDRMRGGAVPSYQPLTKALVDQGLTVWDGADAFRGVSVPVSSLFASGGHYNAAGNRVLANWLETHLDSLRTAPARPCGHTS